MKYVIFHVQRARLISQPVDKINLRLKTISWNLLIKPRQKRFIAPKYIYDQLRPVYTHFLNLIKTKSAENDDRYRLFVWLLGSFYHNALCRFTLNILTSSGFEDSFSIKYVNKLSDTAGSSDGDA